MNPLDLSGLAFFMLLLLSGVSLCVYRLKTEGDVQSGGCREEIDDCFEVAYLSGGEQRVVNAAVGALFARGLLEHDESQVFVSKASSNASDSSDEPLHPMESALLFSIQVMPQPIKLLLPELMAPPLLEMQSSLRRRGYLPTVMQEFTLLITKVLGWGLVALGCAKVFKGWFDGHPTFFLLIAVVVWASLWFAIVMDGGDPLQLRVKRARPLIRVLEGKYWALHTTSQSAPEQLKPHELAMACAIFGQKAYGGSLTFLKQKLPSEKSQVIPRSQLGNAHHSPSKAPKKTSAKDKASSCSVGVIGDSDGGGDCGACGGCGGD